MKKSIILILGSIFLLSYNSVLGFSDDIEIFKTINGEYFCKNDDIDTFTHCSKNELSNKTHIDSTLLFNNGIVNINEKVLCIIQGHESNDISNCDDSYYKFENGISFNCTIKNGIENCTPLQENESDMNIGIINSENNDIASNEKLESGNTTSNPTCKVNGKEVDCSQMTAEMKDGFNSILKYGLVLGIIGLVLIIFYIWMLVDAINKPISNKLVWILVIFFLFPIGAIVYYFVVKRKFNS